MNVIKILPEQEAQKIAAGEVVERPASIVKEIIENAIDAQATSISLHIKKAGKELIRVVDNGCGMSATDAKICFQPHATSKIKKLDDLLSIQSFGFRGEALCSISAVSKVTLITKHKTAENEPGIKVEYESSMIKSEEAIACPVGTDLRIKDIFYNTPARKKFLKQDETEWNQIVSIFYAFCLSNPHIHFKLYRDETLFLHAPSTKYIKNKTSQIWGHNFSQNLLPLQKSEHKDITITGLISNHHFWRYGRHQIFFFVNGRTVKNKELSKALLKGYANVLPPARFPAAFIFITIGSDLVDINVHPRKEEVQFAKPVTVQNLLQNLVKTTLENNVNKKLEAGEKPFSPRYVPHKNILPDFSKPSMHTVQTEYNDFDKNHMPTYPNIKTYSDFAPIKQDKEIDQKEEQTHVTPQNVSTIRGQLFNTYIILEHNDELILIDQHAAHERILYEKFTKNFEKKDGTRLMFPHTVELPPEHIKMILNVKDFFGNQGIELEHFGQNKIAIKTSPPKIQNHDLKELIFEIIAFMQEHEELEKETFRKKLNEHMHAQLACKMAVKAGDVLSHNHMQQIIDDLQKTNNRLTCPHGRPTIWSIAKHEIEKHFKRK